MKSFSQFVIFFARVIFTATAVVCIIAAFVWPAKAGEIFRTPVLALICGLWAAGTALLLCPAVIGRFVRSVRQFRDDLDEIDRFLM